MSLALNSKDSLRIVVVNISGWLMLMITAWWFTPRHFSVVVRRINLSTRAARYVAWPLSKAIISATHLRNSRGLLSYQLHDINQSNTHFAISSVTGCSSWLEYCSSLFRVNITCVGTLLETETKKPCFLDVSRITVTWLNDIF